MNDTQKQQEAWLKGEKAKAILESPLWQECWQDFEKFIVDRFLETESTDKDKLAHWKHVHNVGLRVRQFFERTMAEGSFAAQDLEYQKQRRGIFKLLP